MWTHQQILQQQTPNSRWQATQWLINYYYKLICCYKSIFPSAYCNPFSGYLHYKHVGTKDSLPITDKIRFKLGDSNTPPNISPSLMFEVRVMMRDLLPPTSSPGMISRHFFSNFMTFITDIASDEKAWESKGVSVVLVKVRQRFAIKKSIFRIKKVCWLRSDFYFVYKTFMRLFCSSCIEQSLLIFYNRSSIINSYTILIIFNLCCRGSYCYFTNFLIGCRC